MTRRKIEDSSTRKLLKNGSSISVTLPIDLVRALKWREKQKVVIKKKGSTLTIADWKK